MAASTTVKFDEDVPTEAADVAAARGYVVRTVRGQGWAGLLDPDLWPLVQAEGVFFVTADKEFGDVRLFPPGSHHGIALLRPDRESGANYAALMERLLMTYSLDALVGCLVVVTPRSVRVKRP